MMGSRLELHEQLCEILGSRNVYYQPPESLRIVYPAIVYAKDAIQRELANDAGYIRDDRYMVTFIARNVDDEVIDKLLEFPHISYNRRYATEGLYHDVFTLYY